MKRRLGLSLIWVLAFVSFYGTLMLCSGAMLGQARGRVVAHRGARMASLAAQAGVDYAGYMIARGRWQVARRFVSPDLGRGERFEVEAVPLPEGRWRVVSTGIAGASRQRLERTLP